MIATFKSALLSTEPDERQLTLLVSGACPQTALAAFGALLGTVVSVILRDRKAVRSWLTTTEEASA